jgi:hypothetical protein
VHAKKKTPFVVYNRNQIQARAASGSTPTPSRKEEKKRGDPMIMINKANAEAERLLTNHTVFYLINHVI